MSGSTPELNLKTAVDSDDTADYLTLSLADSLRTVDGLFNNVTGHTHGGARQGGPITNIPPSAIPNGSITSAHIADGTITSADIADGTITSADIADGTIQTIDVAPNAFSKLYVVNATTSDPARTASGTWTDIPEMTITATLPGVADLLCLLVISTTCDVAGGIQQFFLTLDGSPATSGEIGMQSHVTGGLSAVTIIQFFPGVAAGAHTLRGQWINSAGTMTRWRTASRMIMAEFRR